VQGPVNLVRLNQLIDLMSEPALLFPPGGGLAAPVAASSSIFEQVRSAMC
jgi:polyphosphate kinase